MTGSRLTGAVRLLATVAALILGESVLYLAGPRLPALALDPAQLSRTVAEAEPLAVAVSALRMVALVIGALLLLVTVAGIAARGFGAARLVAQVDRLTPPSLRHLLDGAVGAGLAVSIGFTALPAGADPAPSPAATAPARPAITLRRLADASPVPADPPPSVTTLRRLPDQPPPAPSPADAVTTLRRLPDAASPEGDAPDVPPPPANPAPARPGGDAPDVPPPPAANRAPAPPEGDAPDVPPPPAANPAPAASPRAPAPAPSRAAAPEREVVVRPGDSFWRLAHRYEADRLGRAPSEGEVGARWQELVAMNRHRLVVPDDADLLFPGQVLLLPAR